MRFPRIKCGVTTSYGLPGKDVGQPLAGSDRRPCRSKRSSGGLVLVILSLFGGIDFHQIFEYPERQRFRVHEGRIGAIIKFIRPHKTSEILLHACFGEYILILQLSPNALTLIKGFISNIRRSPDSKRRIKVKSS